VLLHVLGVGVLGFWVAKYNARGSNVVSQWARWSVQFALLQPLLILLMPMVYLPRILVSWQGTLLEGLFFGYYGLLDADLVSQAFAVSVILGPVGFAGLVHACVHPLRDAPSVRPRTYGALFVTGVIDVLCLVGIGLNGGFISGNHLLAIAFSLLHLYSFIGGVIAILIAGVQLKRFAIHDPPRSGLVKQ
jgi:hypothetical protein